MRIDELGLQVKLEAVSDLDVFRTDLAVDSSTFLGVSLREKWIEKRINFLADSLNHEDLTSLNLMLRKVEKF